MWGTFLSEPLLIVALVGRYPANKLIMFEYALHAHLSATAHEQRVAGLQLLYVCTFEVERSLQHGAL